jgi:predicted AlkP superfamily pyrophosphatase or phosphodiesterase
VKILTLLALFLCMLSRSASGAPVLLISVDGLRPDYVTHADEHNLRIPTLRRMLREGAHAEGVIPVTPTVTYPNHTTLVTGVMPAEHGIYANTPFDPLGANLDGWYWYAVDVKVPTLWQAVSAAGRVTASVEWPVTVGAPGIRFNIPEYRRAHTPDDVKLDEVLARPDGYLRDLEARLGAYTDSSHEGPEDDQVRTRFAAQILKEQKPAFMTVHLIGLDGASHKAGPFSAQANASLEAIDAMVGTLATAVLANDPAAVVAVVSDHGFHQVNHMLNWQVAFIEAGLLDPQDRSKWKATLWGNPGAAVMLRDPQDSDSRGKVREVLAKLAADPGNGVSQVLEGDAMKPLGAWPEAAFIIGLQPGYVLGSATSGPLVVAAGGGGTHGYLASEPSMRSAFFISGRAIARGRNLGTIDMRQIAPTLALLLQVGLPRAQMPALAVISQ